MQLLRYNFTNIFVFLNFAAVSWWVILIIIFSFGFGLAFLIYICKRHQRNRTRVNVNTIPGQPKRTRTIPVRPQPNNSYPQYPTAAWSSTNGVSMNYGSAWQPPPSYGQVSTISYPQGPPPAYPAATANQMGPSAPGIADPLPPPYPAYGCPSVSSSMPEAYTRRPSRNQDTRGASNVQPSAPTAE